jgi:hypothetical protein
MADPTTHVQESARGRRSELHPEIRRLREDVGLTWREIGARLGISLKTAHDYYTDPTGDVARGRRRRYDATEKSRAANRRRQRTPEYRGRCEDCGALKGIGSEKRGYRLCHECETRLRRAQHAALLDRIENMWNHEGMTGKQIAAALGRPAGERSVSTDLQELRRAGRLIARRRGRNVTPQENCANRDGMFERAA